MNRFESYFKPLTWSMAILAAGVVAGCGGGDDGSPPPRAQAAAIGNISGDWTITETDMTSTAAECTPAGGNPLATYPVTIAQTGDNLTVTDSTNPSDGPAVFTGSLHGPSLTWSGHFAERGGTTTVNSTKATVGADCNTATGTQNWKFVQDPPATFTCTATTTFTAARNTPSATGCKAPESSS